MSTLVALLGAAMAVLVVATVAATIVMTHLLKSRFPSVWQAEGQPERWLWLQPVPASGHVLRFLDERRYLASGDPAFVRFCSVLRLSWYVTLTSFALALVAGFAWALHAQA